MESVPVRAGPYPSVSDSRERFPDRSLPIRDGGKLFWDRGEFFWDPHQFFSDRGELFPDGTQSFRDRPR